MTKYKITVMNSFEYLQRTDIYINGTKQRAQKQSREYVQMMFLKICQRHSVGKEKFFQLNQISNELPLQTLEMLKLERLQQLLERMWNN